MKQFAFFFFLLDRKLIDLPSFNQRRICFEAELYFSKVRLPPTSGCLLPLECSLTEFPIGHLTWSPGLFAQLLVNTSLCFFNSASFFFFFCLPLHSLSEFSNWGENRLCTEIPQLGSTFFFTSLQEFTKSSACFLFPQEQPSAWAEPHSLPPNHAQK